MNNQRPPYPMQPQGTRPPPPHGHPQGPNAAVRPPTTPNANPPMPPVGQQPRLAQGFNPNRPMQSPPLVNPSQPGQPPTMMRPAPSPVANTPMTPQQKQQPRPGYNSPSMAPGISPNMASPTAPPPPPPSTTTEHHRRRRMYPEQITQAYMDEPTTSMAPPAPPPQQQPHQYTAPATQGLAPQQQPYPGYSNQASVSSMATQFGSMSLGGSNAPHSVPLSGLRPQIVDLKGPQPAIRLPPNASLTDSPFANCDPSYKCSTLNAIPSTEQLLKKSRLPLALVLAPYRTVDEGEQPVPVVADSVISRCRRCRTYINPFVTFVEGGQRWKCNMCFLLNDVMSAFDYDSVAQRPVDRWKRAELNYGCVEFVAPTEYMVRPPQAPAYVFVIDVSYSAVQSGMVATAARTILDSLERIPNKEHRTRVAFITVDSSLHFYSLSEEAGEPQMLVVSDLEDVFLPQPTQLLANLSENMEAIKGFLEKLPEMFKATACVTNALGSALQAAYKLVCTNGGKIVCLQSTLPNAGIGALKPREDVKMLGTAKESQLLNPASPFFKSFAVDCSRAQVSCDMLIFGGQYSDVATLGCLPHYTGGQTYYYPGFNASRTEDALKFAHEFSELLAEEIGLEAVIRIRASRGLRMSAFHGNFFIRSTDLLALPNVPRNQSYCVEVSIEDEIKAPTVCFQTALLHTTCHGERRIRVITLCLPVTSSISEIYANANEQALAGYLTNKAIERALSSKLDDARDAIVNKLVDILGIYKSHVQGSAPGSTPQLTAPNNLKLLPLLALCLIKHDGLRQSSQIPTDLRSNAMNLLRTMPLQLLLPYLYPNLYSLHNMPPEAGEITENGVSFPPALNLTAENIEPHGCYLLENGQHIFIWVGRGVVPQLCADLFDVRSYEGLRGGKAILPTLETPINRKVNMLVGKIREMRRGNYYPNLYLVKEDGDPYLRLWFLSHLVEDRTDNIMSYQQFLQHLKDRMTSASY
ncbi:protein transporter sec24 [Lichtheimia corymbifera JMRC:FSU:9682]|uniref:Protein transporter sec24 n=1 Tax=Lichtheimia corymbifera JMRC:FSU:9682 TaxID=1263082 RepID=A0A068RHS6_9FUNG|nr:protein transporter sec24 [Lichtheimia corymbifera JMRC:FSU:9682]